MMQVSQRSPLVRYTTLEVLDRAFRIYRDNFLNFLVPVALVSVPLTLINILVGLWFTRFLDQYGINDTPFNGRSPLLSTPDAFNAFLTGFVGIFAILILVTVFGVILQGVFVNGPLTYLASEVHLGRKPTIGEAFNAVKNRLLTLGGGLLVFYAIVISLSIGLGLILFACGLGFGVLVYVGVALYAFLTPVLILEQVNLSLGMRRAWTLAKACVWQVFGIILAVTLITAALNLALGSLQTLITEQMIAGVSPDMSTVIEAVLQAVMAMFIAPVLPIVLTLLYYDARVRLEGLDILLRITGKADARPADMISPPPARELMTGKDFGNLALMTAGVFALILAYYGLSLAIVGSAPQFF